ncbi:hypothetical protein [Parvularcula maris]|uniref:SPW repeat-containing protein n=1 Tax=Parvularcula maris TaxID=2965077 RepID=A0A9X2L847_9PROT|nr:hypothetical protein [Parvularcula maris]MCQ8184836.1 hypothetical protein [Parvularcula maris]
MRLVSPTVHGVIDYLAAAALILGPLLLFPSATPDYAVMIPIAAGVALIAYSLITDYVPSVRRIIPFPVHLAIDLTAGAVFVVLAFFGGLFGLVQLFYLVMGVAVMAVVLTTSQESDETFAQYTAE